MQKIINYLDKPRTLKCTLPTLQRIAKITGTDLISGAKHWAQACSLENVALVAAEMLKHEDPDVNAEEIIDPVVLQDLISDMIEVSSPRKAPLEQAQSAAEKIAALEPAEFAKLAPETISTIKYLVSTMNSGPSSVLTSA
jgi:hypothetical protein